MTTLVSHIDHAIPALPHSHMYLMHKWWARKPHNVVAEYIRYYSKEGEIVLDPFCGSGVTVAEAIKMNRKAIAVDLDPMAIFISKMTCMPADIKKIEDIFEQIKNDCEQTITELYETTCQVCKQTANTLATIWDRDKNSPTELRYFCFNCKKKMAKNPDSKDNERIKKISKKKISNWYPKVKLSYNGKDFMKKEKAGSIPELYTSRNLLALSILFDRIEKISDTKLKELFRFAFTSMSHLASKMCVVAKPGGKGHWSKLSATSFWAIQSFWVPPIFMESNVWMLFANAINFKQGIIKGKTDSNEKIKKFKVGKNFDDLKSESNILFLNRSALDLSIIPNESIDYVFTDPPYGGAVQYFELSTLWCSWLQKAGNFDLDYKGEITINPSQQKGFDFYHTMLKNAFEEIFRVLKNGKYLTVTFHNTDIKIYNSIQKAAILSGFDLDKVLYQPPARASAKAHLQPFGSAVGDYYLRFRKPQWERTALTTINIDSARYEKIIVECVKKVLAHRGEPTPYTYIINSYSDIYDELKESGYLFTDPENIETVLKKQLNKEFVILKKKNEKGKVIASLWWFKDPSKISFIERVPLVERVEKAVISVLNRLFQATFDDILQEIFIAFPNALTPDTDNVREVLKEYAEQTRDGKWRLKPIVLDRANEHDKLVEFICTLGEKAGFEVYGDTQKRRKNLTFPMDDSKLSRVTQIDALWYKGDKINYEFEVENSTGITEAIVRGTNIEYPVKRIIVIPEERENLLSRKVQEPMLSERIAKDKWLFIRYDDFYDYYNKNKRKRRINPKDVENLHKPPRTIKNENIDNYFD